MLLKEVTQVVMAAIVLWSKSTESASLPMLRLCGRELSDFMSRVCHAYNSPTWDVPTVVEQHTAARKKRQLGISDECCALGCTWAQLTEYCSIIAYSESPLDMDSHKIEDRSVEVSATAKSVGSLKGAGSEAKGPRREVGRRSRGYGRGRRCWCRRKRRTGRRPANLMGNTGFIKTARTAPVVGTVSPLITWGRILNTDLPTQDIDRFAYIVHA